MVDRGKLGNMQSFSCTTLKAATDESVEYGTATDSRDNNEYTIARLKDGKCWMTENLRIVGKTISSADSDMTNGSFTIPNSDMSKFYLKGVDLSTTQWKESNAAYVEDVSYSDPTYGSKNFKSGYYTWYTAAAGTGTASMTSDGQNAAGSICPKGWKLPTGGSGGDFQTLTNAYNISSNTDGSNTLRGDPLNFTYAGGVNYTLRSMFSQGSNGYYWSSTVSTQYNAYSLNFDSSNVNPINNNRPFGFSVRCVKYVPTCFTASTLVDTPSGQVPIEDINEGMTVYSYDVDSNKLVEDKVVKTISDNHNQTVILTFEDESIIHASYNHRFYDLDNAEWKLIGDFKAGDKLKTIDGTVSIVKSVVKDPNNENVYNFETENYHNYFIFSRDTHNRYLVHNIKTK